MTTIAYRSGILSADTLISYTSITNGFRDKLAITSKFIVALAGVAWLREALEGWAEQGCPPAEVPSVLAENEDKFQALFLAPGGDLFQYDSGYLVPVCAEYHAIGSGASLAIGAMAFGASAEQAVAAAAVHDKNTGGNVQSLHHTVLGL